MLKEAKRKPHRVYTLLHCYSGARREGDLQEQVRDLMAKEGLPVLVVSIDTGLGEDHDLADPRVFHKLYSFVCEGLIDAVVGGPPCSTWSRLRFLPNGPRPIRFRDQPWGRRDATKSEARRIGDGNLLMVNFLALLEGV